MLEIKKIAADKAYFIEGLEKRHFKNASDIIGELLDLDEQRKTFQQENDQLLSELKKLSQQIGLLMKEGKSNEAENAKTRTLEIKEKNKTLIEDQRIVEEKIAQILYQIPNIPHQSVRTGKSASENEEVERAGKIPELEQGAKPHWDLISEKNIIDFELGNKITGAGFPVYKGKGAKIQRALINFFLNEAEKAGFEEVQPPILINKESGYGTGQLPDKDGQMYHATEDDLYLIPTAEVPITNMYRDIILEEKDLPIKHVGYTPCFRREAGSWGAHVRGLNRLHQFDKVEIVYISKPEESSKILDSMCDYVGGLLAKLELPYRKLRLCTGDLGFTSSITYDFEVFSAAQKKWLEVSSVSNFETFQANRMKLRFRDSDKNIQLAHTLNGSALALPRILATILENNQKGGDILIPKVLVPFTGFDKI